MPTTIPETHRMCRICRGVFPIEQFPVSAAYKSGRETRCRSCKAAAAKEKYEQAKSRPASSAPKVCRACGQKMPATRFSTHPFYKDGRYPDCRDCRSKAAVERARKKSAEDC